MRKWKNLKTNKKKAKRFWFRILAFLKYKVWKKFNNFWWFIKYHTTHRYHVVNVSGQCGYRVGYQDKDYLIFLVCFKLLRDFVELEDSNVGTRTEETFHVNDSSEDWLKESVRNQLEREKEIRVLYDWYMDHSKKSKSITMESYEEEQAMLERLIKVRCGLWT